MYLAHRCLSLLNGRKHTAVVDIVNLTGSRATEEIDLLECLGESFQIGLAEVGRPILTVGGTIPWVRVIS